MTQQTQKQELIKQTAPESGQEVSKAAAGAKQAVNLGDYEKYCELKFMQLDGARFKDEAKKQLDTLEAKIKSCKGEKPTKTVTASIGMERVRLVAGIPVPVDILKLVGDKKEYYF